MQQKLFLSEADLAKVRSGEINAVIRLRAREVECGELTFDSGLSVERVFVTDVLQIILGYLTDDMAWEAGYESVEQFMDQWRPHSKGTLFYRRPISVVRFTPLVPAELREAA